GALPSFVFRKNAPAYHPLGKAFGDAFWLLECVNCNSWSRHEQRPIDPIGLCTECGHPLEPKRSAECREPLGFRTSFRRGEDADSDAPSGRYRSILAEATASATLPIKDCNTKVSVRPTRIYRLNRGETSEPAGSGWQGFNLVTGSDLQRGHRGATAAFEEQVLDESLLADKRFGARGFTAYEGGDARRIAGTWLAAPKTTDLLSMLPSTLPVGLQIDNLNGARLLIGLEPQAVLRALSATAVRAAALSATFLLVGRAAEKLDIDPEEFDIIEPRCVRPGGGFRVPILQFADHLVNGAGFCRELARDDGLLLGQLIQDCLNASDVYPLRDILRGNHEILCETACYLCMLRYRNQPFHGLLDWRLGLAYLAAFSTDQFSCGLDNDFNSPFLKTWKENVDRDVQRVTREFPRTESKKIGALRALRFETQSRWAVIAHPLWDADTPAGILADAIGHLMGEPFVIVDSFNVARRPVTIRRAVLDWKST
ncbi:MAG: hypothetical protein ABI142_05865, partial [Bryocella sp.]